MTIEVNLTAIQFILSVSAVLIMVTDPPGSDTHVAVAPEFTLTAVTIDWRSGMETEKISTLGVGEQVLQTGRNDIFEEGIQMNGLTFH